MKNDSVQVRKNDTTGTYEVKIPGLDIIVVSRDEIEQIVSGYNKTKHQIHTMTGQTGQRVEFARKKWKFVFGSSPKFMTNKGKYYYLNHTGLKETYELAKTKCPEAADAIVAHVWDEVVNMQTLQYLAEEWEGVSYVKEEDFE